MTTNGTNGHSIGGAGGSLQLDRGKDREYLRRSISDGWKVTPEQLAKYAQALDTALELAIQAGNPREIRGCVATMKAIADQIQADEQLAEKYLRIDRGDATEAIKAIESDMIRDV